MSQMLARSVLFNLGEPAHYASGVLPTPRATSWNDRVKALFFEEVHPDSASCPWPS